MGLGDIASILVPSVKFVDHKYPNAIIDVATYKAGVELMALEPRVDSILEILAEQWPSDILPSIQSFMGIATLIESRNYDLIINLDTWFMPCVLGRMLKDMGQSIEGNYVSYSIDSLVDKLLEGRLLPEHVRYPEHYLDSSYRSMKDWPTLWWDRFPNAGSYPVFYLNHCCGFKGEVDISVDVPSDIEFKDAAFGKKIIALSVSGSTEAKQYPHQDELKQRLEDNGFFVWGKFDGSVPMKTTLSRLKVTDLLVTVATSTQWLAKLVDCPSLVMPGALPASVLGAEFFVEKSKKCLQCKSGTCKKGKGVSCMNIPPEQIAKKVIACFKDIELTD
jgi:ADP-heptose:LPS heptosyltransferase